MQFHGLRADFRVDPKPQRANVKNTICYTANIHDKIETCCAITKAERQRDVDQLEISTSQEPAPAAWRDPGRKIIGFGSSTNRSLGLGW